MRTIWYWIETRDENNRPVLLGPYNNSNSADEAASAQLDRDYEVVTYPTKDKSKASSMYKAKLLERSRDLDSSLKPVKRRIGRRKAGYDDVHRDNFV